MFEKEDEKKTFVVTSTSPPMVDDNMSSLKTSKSQIDGSELKGWEKVLRMNSNIGNKKTPQFLDSDDEKEYDAEEIENEK